MMIALYLILWLLWAVVEDLVLRRRQPALRAKRLRDPNVPVWLGLLLYAWLGVCALTRDALPVWIELFGAAIFFHGRFYGVSALMHNRFAIATTEIQLGHQVVATGPYAWVRHPMYRGSLLVLLGTPLIFGSVWGLVGSAILGFGVCRRAGEEDEMLRAGLPGYYEYAQKVKRLI